MHKTFLDPADLASLTGIRRGRGGKSRDAGARVAGLGFV